MGAKLSPRKTAAKTAKFKATMAAKRAAAKTVDIPIEMIPDRPNASVKRRAAKLANKYVRSDDRVTLALELVRLVSRLLA